MVWLWITVIVLALVGSLTWILPSPMERRQGKRRAEALALGLKVRILTLESWASERLEIDRLPQYMLWCQSKLRPFTLWRVADREEPWASPPTAHSWDLVTGALATVLAELPPEILGVGAEGSIVWLAWDDAGQGPEPEAIRGLLRDIAAILET